MTLNAASQAARLSSAPMVDGGDFGIFSMGCGSSCAAHVHVPIALSRAASNAFRCASRCSVPQALKVPIREEKLLFASSKNLHVLLKVAISVSELVRSVGRTKRTSGRVGGRSVCRVSSKITARIPAPASTNPGAANPTEPTTQPSITA